MLQYLIEAIHSAVFIPYGVIQRSYISHTGSSPATVYRAVQVDLSLSAMSDSNSSVLQTQADKLLVDVPAGDAMKGKGPIDWPSDAILRRYTGGCHCKQFTFEFSCPLFGEKPESEGLGIPVIHCTCSICAIKGEMTM